MNLTITFILFIFSERYRDCITPATTSASTTGKNTNISV